MKHNQIFIPVKEGIKYSSVLEEGDYIPYFVYREKYNKISIQNSAGKSNIFIITDTCLESTLNKCVFNLPYHIICKNSEIINNHIITDEHIYNLFPSEKIIITDSNLKIFKITDINFDINIINYNIPYKTDPPILIVPNAISESFKNDILDFFHKSDRKNIEMKGTKNRTHVFADKYITKKLDDKLTRSLFPEIKKIYNLDVTYRENYKICGYSEKDRGKFHLHRDSVYPYGHRRYAMTLILNDGYEGGGIVFPEYNNKAYKPSPLSAVIFPAPLFHKVLEVTKGNRYVIVSFLLGDIEAAYKKKFITLEGKTSNLDSYKIKVTRDLRNITIDDICPQK